MKLNNFTIDFTLISSHPSELKLSESSFLIHLGKVPRGVPLDHASEKDEISVIDKKR